MDFFKRVQVLPEADAIFCNKYKFVATGKNSAINSTEFFEADVSFRSSFFSLKHVKGEAEWSRRLSCRVELPILAVLPIWPDPQNTAARSSVGRDIHR